jgi:hypothetical protein
MYNYLDDELTKLRAEIERLREALKFYACGCEGEKCVVTKPKFKDIRCGKTARDVLKEGK